MPLPFCGTSPAIPQSAALTAPFTQGSLGQVQIFACWLPSVGSTEQKRELPMEALFFSQTMRRTAANLLVLTWLTTMPYFAPRALTIMPPPM